MNGNAEHREDEMPLDRSEDGSDGGAFDPITERIVAFVDGALSPVDAHQFEVEIANSSDLARRVERAQCLRRLVAGLPRFAAQPSLARFAERVAGAHSWRAASGLAEVSVDHQLAALRRATPPADLIGTVMASVREERAILTLSTARRNYRPGRAQWVPILVAAALLLSVTTWLVGSRTARGERPKSGRSFVFNVAMLRPGYSSPGVAVDSTLVPPAFATRTRGAR